MINEWSKAPNHSFGFLVHFLYHSFFLLFPNIRYMPLKTMCNLLVEQMFSSSLPKGTEPDFGYTWSVSEPYLLRSKFGWRYSYAEIIRSWYGLDPYLIRF